MAFTVYGNPYSTCTQKVLLTLAEKGAEARLVPIDLQKGEHKQPEHVARQPFGVIPVLEEDDGFRLYESRAIIRYLDAKLPGVALTPAEARARGRMEQWISVEQSHYSGASLTLVKQLVWGRAAGREPDMTLVEGARRDLERTLDVLEAGLGDQPFFGGAAFSLADICLLPYTAALAGLGLLPPLEGRPRLARWLSACVARPSWQKVAPRRG